MIHSTSLQRGLALLLLAAPVAALAAGPGSGSQSQSNFRVGSCQVSSMQVIYKLDSLMGEPTVSGSYKWTGDGSCTLPSSTTIWLKVEDGSGGRGYVRLKPAVPQANGAYGYNTTGSPDWDEALCGFSGNRRTSCLPPNGAKNLWKSGRVTDFSVTW
tara:strand:+ start:24935 stop:25405 length:471 start_codon:yes stop_codon:yes gene_type:complete